MPVSEPVGDEPVEHVEVRRGEYHDSVTLMLAARAVAAVAGVERVLVAMATELNVALLAELGYAAVEDVGVGDLIVAFTCRSAGAGAADPEAAALEALSGALAPTPATAPHHLQPGGSITAPGHPTTDHPSPRTTASALGRTSAPITLISTPGLASVAEAVESLEYGANPIIFSDNIPIFHEVRLKEEARRRGLLVMGPDCGTVVLHGTGLAFANVTNPGPISLVAASGTGAQQLMALLNAAGTGIRHCLGVGGRDLTEQVAGRSTLAALTALADDEETQLITVVSKPPHPTIAARIKAHAETLAKPVHFAFVGPEHPTLTEAAEQILAALGRSAPPQPGWPRWEPVGAEPAAAQTNAPSMTTATVPDTNTTTTEVPGPEPAASSTVTPSTVPTPAPCTTTTQAPPTEPATTSAATAGMTSATVPGTTPAEAPGAEPAVTSATVPGATPTAGLATVSGRAGMVRGLFSGGTLRAEAEVVLARAGGRAVDGGTAGGWGAGESRRLQSSADRAEGAPDSATHAQASEAANFSAAPATESAAFAFDLTDFGDDAYTRGRPHPMIDNTLRLRAVAEAAADAGVGVLLLDVVLGRGAHADPAAELGGAIAAARAGRAGVAVVVSLCGTDGDPQGLVRQAEVLAAAGAWVFLSNAEAAGAAARLALGGVSGVGAEGH